MRGLLLAAVALLISSGVLANPQVQLPNITKDFLTPERMEQAEREGRLSERDRKALEIAREIARQGAAVKPDQTSIDTATPATKQARTVVNEALLKEREAVMRLMGLDPTAKGKLYIMISSSMSDSLIQAYAREAMWAGAILVVRGIPPGMTLKEYMRTRIYEWVRNKGATAMVDLDPRPFSLYQVKHAPTIVYTEVEEEDLIGLCEPAPEDWGGASFNKCGQVDPSLYWKVEGGVTLAWALNKMVENGATGAKRYLDALSKAGFSSRTSEQKPFVGNWAEAPTPQELKDMNDRLGLQGLEAYSTPQGITAIGPRGIPMTPSPPP